MQNLYLSQKIIYEKHFEIKTLNFKLSGDIQKIIWDPKSNYDP